MAWIAPVAAAGASLIGDAMSAQSASSINQKTMNFDADMMRQQEAFQASQSANAVQTRVADIRKAGLNPLLAVTGGGAPAAQAMSGSAPTAQLQNPGAAYANLGSQISSAAQVGVNAAQTSSNVDLNSASAANARADAALKAAQAFKLSNADTNVANATVQSLLQGTKTSASQAALNQSTIQLQAVQADSQRAQQLLMGAQTAQAKAQVPVLQASVLQLLSSANLNDQNAALARIQQAVGNLSVLQTRSIMGDVISQAAIQTKLMNQRFNIDEVMNNFMQTNMGKAAPYLQQVQSVLGTIRSFIPFTSGAGTSEPMSDEGVSRYLQR